MLKENDQSSYLVSFLRVQIIWNFLDYKGDHMVHKKKVVKFGSLEERLKNVVFSDDDVFNIGAHEDFMGKWLLDALPQINHPEELEITGFQVQKNFIKGLTDHTIRTDLYIEALHNRRKKLLVFEMQNKCNDRLGPRSVYYAFYIGQNALEAGSDYDKLADITVVFLCRTTVLNAKNFVERYTIKRDSDFEELPASPEWIFLFADQAIGNSRQDKLMRDLFAESYKDVKNKKAREFLMNLIYDMSPNNQLDAIDLKNIELQEKDNIILEKDSVIKEQGNIIHEQQEVIIKAKEREKSNEAKRRRLEEILTQHGIPFEDE